jgi:hypothetical protein
LASSRPVACTWSSSSADESLDSPHNRGTPELTETFREFHSTVAVALYHSSVASTPNTASFRMVLV